VLIRLSHPSRPGESQVTPESVYLDRRRILRGLGLGAALAAGRAHAGLFDFLSPGSAGSTPGAAPRSALEYQEDASGFDLTLTPEEKATSHNNFYEFGTGKTDPLHNSQALVTDPWTLRVEGEVAKPGSVDIGDLIASSDLEERIYRLRCVEAWSMVIPWIGLELGRFLKRFEPTGRARFVAFETLHDPAQMPGQRSRYLGGGVDYPYVEGLRIDEAMHPLALLGLGMYGKTLPPQNGAPVRLIVPWKYGFKSIKSIVSIRLVEHMPPTSWNLLAPQEYGFYANVNPSVDHPRWSQATERFIGPGGVLDVRRQPTLPFNGYGDDVADLYAGMDLRRFY